jgi:hypothetical protein
MLKANVTTICFGYAASAATLIAQGATKGNRQIASSSLYLIHQSMTGRWGNTADFEEGIQFLRKTDGSIAGIYAAASGGEVEKYTELMGRNNGKGEWLTAKEALENGLVDTILDVSSAVNLDTSSLQMFRYPAIPQDKVIEVLPPVPVVPTASGQTPPPPEVPPIVKQTPPPAAPPTAQNPAPTPEPEPQNKENNTSDITINAVIARANAALSLSNC